MMAVGKRGEYARMPSGDSDRMGGQSAGGETRAPTGWAVE
jgi:hypothetical protein